LPINKELAVLLWDRLAELSRYFVCRPRTLQPPEKNTGKPRINLSSVPPKSYLFLYGSLLEKQYQDFSQLVLRKPLHVPEAEEILRWMGVDGLAVPIPGTCFEEYFDCDLSKNIVYEIYFPRIPEKILEALIDNKIPLIVPRKTYILSYKELIEALEEILVSVEHAEVFVLSKYAQLGYIQEFIKTFGGEEQVTLHIATENPSKAKKLGSTTVTPTRSHRKLLLIIYRMKNGEEGVVGYRGSMNIFYPGVDDYLEAVNDIKDLQILMHGILRAFLAV